jgi:hypothetical protein
MRTRKSLNKTMMSLTRCVLCCPFVFFIALLSFVFYYIQVDAFLEAHDTGVTDADREVAKGQYIVLPIVALIVQLFSSLPTLFQICAQRSQCETTAADFSSPLPRQQCIFRDSCF